MRWQSVLLGSFIILIGMLGCGRNSTTPVEHLKEIQPSLTESATPTGEPSATPLLLYPIAEQSVEETPYQSGEAYSETEGTATQEVTSPATIQTPTPHIDIIMRATDPDAFVISSGKYQLVEFFAFWCPTCKSMVPVLKNLEHKYMGKVQFIYLDIDDPKTNSFKQILGYQYQPHIFLIDGEGKVIKQWVGYVAEEELDIVLSSLQ